MYVHEHALYIYIYTLEVGGVSSTGKSFRVVPCVRACVRAVWMPSENQIKTGYVWIIPVSLVCREVVKFPLGNLVSPHEFKVNSNWNRSELQ